jgi:ribosomal protein S18 acetylase RimI-like enzyme
MTREEILALEEMNFNAWPALKAVHYDGWLLRCTGGSSRRPNSVNCIAPGGIELDRKITAAEAQYARWGRPAVFRLTPLADEGLDQLLAERGYALQEPTNVQVATAEAYPVSDDVILSPSVASGWIEAACAVRGYVGEEAAIFAAQQRAVGVASVWALIRVEDKPAAIGIAAIERGWAGLHGIHVAKHARRRGLARRVTEALLGFSYTQGARRAWLQVAQANAAALPLYCELGFRTAFTYHHRVLPL